MFKTKIPPQNMKQSFIPSSTKLSLRPFLNNLSFILQNYKKSCDKKTLIRKKGTHFNLSLSIQYVNYPKTLIYMRLRILQTFSHLNNQKRQLKHISLTNSSKKNLKQTSSKTKHSTLFLCNNETLYPHSSNMTHNTMNTKKRKISTTITTQNTNNLSLQRTSSQNAEKKRAHTRNRTEHLKLKNVYKQRILQASKYLLLNSSTDTPFSYLNKNSLIKRPEHLWCIALAPVHLQGLDGIARAFGKGKATIKEWRDKGAPIAYDGSMYFSEYNTLFAWFLNNSPI